MWKDKECKSFTSKASKFTQRVEQKNDFVVVPTIILICQKNYLLTLSHCLFLKTQWMKNGSKSEGKFVFILCALYTGGLVIPWKISPAASFQQPPEGFTYYLLLVPFSWICKIPRAQSSSIGYFCPNGDNKGNILMLETKD